MKYKDLVDRGQKIVDAQYEVDKECGLASTEKAYRTNSAFAFELLPELLAAIRDLDKEVA